MATTHRAFKFLLNPTDSQRGILAQTCGMNRRAYNFSLELKNRQMEKRNLHIKSLIEMGKTEEDAKKEVKGLYKIPNAFSVKKVWIWLRDTRDWSLMPDEMKKAPSEFELEIISDWIEAHRNDEEVRGVFPWFSGLNSYAASSGFDDADIAYKNYFDSLTGKRKGRKMGRPKFKKKGRSTDSYKICHDKKSPSIRLESYSRIRIPGVGSVRIVDKALARRMHSLMKRADGKVLSLTVSRAADRWYGSVLVEFDENTLSSTISKVSSSRPDVGLDLGVAIMGATSDGQIFDNLKPASYSYRKLVKAQRALSRTKKGSTRRKKLAQEVAKIHHKSSLQRANAQHQMTTQLVRDFATIAIEDLKVSSMTRSAKGTIESPGTNVKAKSGLNRSVLDVGFGEIRRQLEYKSERRGNTLVAVNPVNTSRMCSKCGYTHKDNRKSQALFECVACGHTMNADVNAAINIRNRARQAPDAAMP